jgi:hypothetical protein
MYGWDWHGAETLFHKSLAVQPGSDFSMHMYAMFALLPQWRVAQTFGNRAHHYLSTRPASSRAGPIDSCAIFICKEIT